MSNLASTLREASSKNSSLLSELAATDYALSSLKQNTAYIADLKTQISNTDKELTRLHAITEDERKVCTSLARPHEPGHSDAKSCT